MKKLITSTIVLILSLSAFADSLYAGTYSGGAGEPNNPYKISAIADWQELMATHADWNKSFLLTADIDLVGVTLTPVGKSYTKFTGIFDGNSHVIRNAVINQPDGEYIGIFGFTDKRGQIQNLGVENVNITGKFIVGGLVGANSGSITSCYSTGNVNGYRIVGGLVGLNDGGSISNCYSAGPVSGFYCVGDLVGWNVAGSISNCYSTGQVNGAFNSHNVGGLVGQSYRGSISNCYSTGQVNGAFYSYAVGGLVGDNDDGSISNCYSMGSASGYAYVGGLVGDNEDGSISNCYSIGSVGGYAYVGGSFGHNGGIISNCHSTASVSGSGNNIGGLVGWSDGIISNCYSMGSVSGSSYVSGLVGNNGGGSISNCYSMGSVNGYAYVGGLVGRNYIGNISNCCSTGEVSGSSDVGGLVGDNGGNVSGSFWDVQTSGQSTSDGGTGKTTEEMQTLATFLDAGWDFVCETASGADDIWFMLPDDYPRLTWEYTPEFDLSVSPTILWPANHKMVKITPAWTATDLCGQPLEVSLVDITANEPCNPDDIKIAPDGSISLCATRSGNSKNRIYTLVYQACDSSANYTTQTATVVVPHDMRK